MTREDKVPKNAYFLTMNTPGPARYAVRCVSLADTRLLQQLAREHWLQISRDEYCDILRRHAAVQGKPDDHTTSVDDTDHRIPSD